MPLKGKLKVGLPYYDPKGIAGAVADTAVKASGGILHAVVINTVGHSASTIKLYDGAVSGTAYATLSGATRGYFVFDARHGTSIHVATVDSAGTLDVTILYA
jgi:hypothetical protein